MRALIVLGVLVGIPLAFGLALHDSPPIIASIDRSTNPTSPAAAQVTTASGPIVAGGKRDALWPPAPTTSATKDEEPDLLLACQSLDLYKRFADFDFSRNGVVRAWASGPMPQELSDNFGLCTWLIDDPYPQPNNYHVEKTDNGYTCILAPWRGAPDSVATTCFWTAASKLRYIGLARSCLTSNSLKC
jgi:hypothetical protein